MLSGALYLAGIWAGLAAAGVVAAGGDLGRPGVLPDIPQSWLTLLNTLGMVVVMVLHAASGRKRKARPSGSRAGRVKVIAATSQALASRVRRTLP
jgi:hypothetical protein